MHDRLEDQINTSECADLLESIRKHGQKHAVLGRPVSDSDGYEIELIFGARRLFAARHLGIDLIVDIRDLDDRAAVVEMDIENRHRKDISPYERGLAYRRWLNTNLFKSQADIAKELKISEAQVSRLLRFADLPAAVVGAFASPSDIREEWAVNLANCCQSTATRQSLTRRARDRAASLHREKPQAIYDALVSDIRKETVVSRPRHEIVRSADGVPLFRIAFRAKTVHFIVSRDKITTSVLQTITEQIKRTCTSFESLSDSPAATTKVLRTNGAGKREASATRSPPSS